MTDVRVNIKKCVFSLSEDQEARRRATTVYLADRRFDMLPEVLSSNLCSLLGGVDRYAVSVIWELDSRTHKVQRVRTCRTLYSDKVVLQDDLQVCKGCYRRREESD